MNIPDAEERIGLKRGNVVSLKGGTLAEVVGAGLIDYAPDGPSYEVVEIEERASGRRSLMFSIDLFPMPKED